MECDSDLSVSDLWALTPSKQGSDATPSEPDCGEDAYLGLLSTDIEFAEAGYDSTFSLVAAAVGVPVGIKNFGSWQKGAEIAHDSRNLYNDQPASLRRLAFLLVAALTLLGVTTWILEALDSPFLPPEHPAAHLGAAVKK
ncbi:uncharacterized protein LOC144167802 [Haemaphysalis longicornis]